jgi:tryptophan halogenase
VLSTYEYAYHLDAAAYTRLLRALAERLGAVAIDQDLAHCEVGSGHIRSVTLDDGTRITADLFIDCTGTRASLLGGALGAPFESWRAWLPCDAALVARMPPAADLPPYTRITAHDQGWRWRVPLRSAVAEAFFFDSRAGMALPEFGGTLESPRQVAFENGMHREAWRGNCVAIGAAAGFIEPLASTGLRLIEGGITQLIALFPQGGDLRVMAAEYNRMLGEQYDRARDFVFLHYLLSRRDGPLGRGRAAPPPAELVRCLALFRHRGRMMFDEDDMFEEAWWACACIGLGVRPERFSVLAEQGSETDLLATLDKIRRVMRSSVESLPAHRTYLDRYLGGQVA